MEPPDTRTDVLAATHLIYRHHAEEVAGDEFEGDDGTCCFCAHEGPGLPTTDAISHKYFSDYDLMQTDSGHVCAACAYCMNQRSLKNGHWIAAANRYDSISTGDLPEHFQQLRDGAYESPLAVHLTSSPIQSFHSYLWTPLNHSHAPLVLDFDREAARLSWPDYDDLLEAVEDLRWHGFTLKEIRSGEPRLSNLQSVGRRQWAAVNEVIDPYRRTPELEAVITLSRAADDQDRNETTDGNTKLTKYV